METIQLKKKQKLTKRQRGYVKDYVLDENGTQAVLKNYNVKDNTVAASISTENLRKPYIAEAIEIQRETLKSALEKEGITPAYIAEKVNVLLKAKGKDKYTAIDKGLKHATNIYGVTTEPEDKPKGNTYNFIFSADVQAEIKKTEEIIKAQLIKNHVQEN